MNEGNCGVCQVCYSCQGQEQISGQGCGNCYTCQVNYAGPPQMERPGGQVPAGGRPPEPPCPQNRQPRPVFDWELRDLNAKLDNLIGLLEKVAEGIAQSEDTSASAEVPAK